MITAENANSSNSFNSSFLLSLSLPPPPPLARSHFLDSTHNLLPHRIDARRRFQIDDTLGRRIRRRYYTTWSRLRANLQGHSPPSPPRQVRHELVSYAHVSDQTPLARCTHVHAKVSLTRKHAQQGPTTGAPAFLRRVTRQWLLWSPRACTLRRHRPRRPALLSTHPPPFLFPVCASSTRALGD